MTEGVYFFSVAFNDGALQPVCMLESNGKGNASCSTNHFDLAGFNRAVVTDMDGHELISGIFVRRGGNREK